MGGVKDIPLNRVLHSVYRKQLNVVKTCANGHLCIQRPPVLRGHSVMSQRCLRIIF